MLVSRIAITFKQTQTVLLLMSGIVYIELHKFGLRTMIWYKGTNTMVDNTIYFENIRSTATVYRLVKRCSHRGESKQRII
jgi:hypothetical protein